MFGLLWGGVGPVWVPACDIAPFPAVVKMDSRWGLFTVCGNGVRPNLNANNPRAIADFHWWLKTNSAGIKRRSARVLCIRGRAASRAPLPDDP